MDPKNGEISRAMRNRCIEVCMNPVSVDSQDTIALLEVAGITVLFFFLKTSFILTPSSFLLPPSSFLLPPSSFLPPSLLPPSSLLPPFPSYLPPSSLPSFFTNSDLFLKSKILPKMMITFHEHMRGHPLMANNLNLRDLIHWANLFLEQVQRGLPVKKSLFSAAKQAYQR